MVRRSLYFHASNLPSGLKAGYSWDKRNYGKRFTMKIVFIIAIFLLTSSISMKVGTSASAPSGIRLSWTQDATDTTMTIMWETSSSGNSNEVQYGLTTACEIGTVSGFSFTDSWGVLHNHQVELTGLSPNTKYFYKVSGDTGEWSPVYNFTSAPDSNVEWSFLVAADSRSYYNDWDAVVGAMEVNDNARLLFFGGDILNDFDSQSEWYQWMDPAERLISSVPFISNKGNHEDDVTGDPWDNYLNTFAFPSNEEYFSFDYGKAHFIVLNTEDSWDAAQKTWLENDLQSASTEPSIEWIFVSHHRPPYSSGGHDSELDARTNFVPLYQQYGVDMVFAGHNHFYQRTYPLNCTNIDSPVISDWGKEFYYYPETIYAVVGRAGAPEYTPTNGPGWFVEDTMSGELHYMKVDIHTNKSIHATTRYTDNTIFDDFWLIREGVAPPPPPPPPAMDTITLIDAGDTWSYSETDPQPVTSPAWNEPGFDDSGWTSGPAPFGFGDSTTYGTVLNDNDGSYYFRKSFDLSNASDIQSAKVNVSSDNYALVYLNGIMIDDDVGADHEFAYWNRMTSVSPSVFQNGTNTVAVFVYNSGGSSDAYMDLDLKIKVPAGSVPPPPPSQSPEQIHIATTGDPTEMSVTWVTMGMTPASTVEFGTASGVYDFSTTGTNHSYSGWSGYIHDVLLSGLIPDTKYYYRVGDENLGWSSEFDFMSPPDYHKNVTFAAIADHGQSSRAEATTGNIIADPSPIDLIVHPGDLSYANGNQPEWDIWFNQIEENAARRPYMIVAGNHETAYDIPSTLARFNNPYLQSGSDSEFYYSFNYSMIHFVAICSDVNYDIGSDQYKWLEDDLAAADSDRTNHPWIIVFSHRPMYSSNLEHGSDLGFRSEMEDLLDQYNVDLAIYGHDHAYERTYPVYQGTPSDTDPRLYVSPSDTIHMVAGMAGAGLYTSWADPQPSWSAYREAMWGYVRVTVDTDGNLHSEFIRNVDHKVRDEFWIVKEGKIPSIPPLTQEVNILQEGDIWLYSEMDPQPVTSPAWYEPGFDDSGWSSGPAPFGFGDSTTYGTVLNDNDGSYYFRKTFEIQPGEEFNSITLYVASDNDAIVYLNGIVVDDDSGADHEFAYWNRAVDIPVGSLMEGTNTIAVVVYNSAGSSDAYMDLRIDAEIIVDQRPTLTLHPGWNMISIPYVLPITDVETVFSSISGSFDAIQCYDPLDVADPWKHYHVDKPSHLNDLHDVRNTNGIWIHITDSQDVLFEVPGFQATDQQSISLKAGWNLVGYPRVSNANRTAGLNNTIFGTHVDRIMWYNSSAGNWNELGTNDDFVVGRGYWAHALTDHVWNLKLEYDPQIRLSIPAYFSPGPLWDTAISDAPATAVMIMNPSNGPGSSYDPGFGDAVTQAQEDGIKVLGYVFTLYGGRSDVDVKADIDDYMIWYGVDGIFLDEVSNDAVDLGYYQDLANYIRSKSGSFIMINPGTVPDEQYMDAADAVIVFENVYSDYTTATFPTWMDSYSRARFMHLVYDTPEADFQNAWSQAMGHNVGYVYITDDTGPNPWDSLPTYWDSEVYASDNS